MRDGTEVQGLTRRADGRWKISATGQTFVEPDEVLALARFRAIEGKRMNAGSNLGKVVVHDDFGGAFRDVLKRADKNDGSIVASVIQPWMNAGKYAVSDETLTDTQWAWLSSFSQRMLPMIVSAAKWAAANKQIILTTLGVAAAVGAALLILPRLVMTIGAVTTAIKFMGTALKFAFAHPLLTIGIGAVVAWAAVLIRSISTNESWSESAYQMSRSVGLFRSATQDLGQAMKDMGELKNEIFDAKDAVAGAKGLDDQIDANQELITLLQRRLDSTKQIIKLQKASMANGDGRGDIGYGQRQLDEAKQQLRAAQAAQERLQQMDAQAKAKRFALPTMASAAPFDLNAAKNAEEIQKLTDGLKEQAATAGMTAARVELYKLAVMGATRGQLDLARQFINEAEAKQKIADVSKSLAELQQQVTRFGATEGQTKVMDLQAAGASPDQLASAQRMVQTLDALNRVTTIQTDNPLADFRQQMDGLLDLYNQGAIKLDQLKHLGQTARQSMNERLVEQAKGITESVRSPLEKYQEELERLNVLLQRGLINQTTFDRATANAAQSFQGTTGTEAPAPDVLKAGSAAAQRFVFDQTSGQQKLTRDDVPKKQLAEAQDASRSLQEIARNTRGTGTAVQVRDI